MGRRSNNASSRADADVAIALIRAVKELVQDPMISTMAAWYWVEKKSGLNLKDRSALRLGIIDISAARAKVDSSIVLQAFGEVKDIAGDLAKGLGMAAGGTPGIIAGTAATVMSNKGKGKKEKSLVQKIEELEALGYQVYMPD